jgi:hypothetical protein
MRVCRLRTELPGNAVAIYLEILGPLYRCPQHDPVVVVDHEKSQQQDHHDDRRRWAVHRRILRYHERVGRQEHGDQGEPVLSGVREVPIEPADGQATFLPLMQGIGLNRHDGDSMNPPPIGVHLARLTQRSLTESSHRITGLASGEPGKVVGLGLRPEVARSGLGKKSQPQSG